MKFMETAAKVSGERGMVRLRGTAYGSDGMTIVETGESAALTPHAALATGRALVEAATKILQEQQATEELERRRA